MVATCERGGCSKWKGALGTKGKCSEGYMISKQKVRVQSWRGSSSPDHEGRLFAAGIFLRLWGQFFARPRGPALRLQQLHIT